MRKFIFILIAFIASLTIQAQQVRLDKKPINTCVVQQHIDVGVTIQHNNFYIAQTFLLPVNIFYYEVQPTASYTTNSINYYTSYTEQYRRGVGLISTSFNNNIKTNNLIELADVYTAYNYQNIQKYYCEGFQ